MHMAQLIRRRWYGSQIHHTHARICPGAQTHNSTALLHMRQETMTSLTLSVLVGGDSEACGGTPAAPAHQHHRRPYPARQRASTAAVPSREGSKIMFQLSSLLYVFLFCLSIFAFVFLFSFLSFYFHFCLSIFTLVFLFSILYVFLSSLLAFCLCYCIEYI